MDKRQVEEMLEQFQNAQQTLQQGFEELEDAVRTLELSEDDFLNLSDDMTEDEREEMMEALDNINLPSARSLEAYMLGHLQNWIQGGNPYDETLDQVIDKLENLFRIIS